MGASAGGITALGGSAHPTKVPGEGTDPCSRSSFATKNLFDVLQDLSESIGGSPRPQLEAADGPIEPITQDLHQSLIELFFRHGGFPPKTSSQTAHNARFLEGQPREWNPYK